MKIEFGLRAKAKSQNSKLKTQIQLWLNPVKFELKIRRNSIEFDKKVVILQPIYSVEALKSDGTVLYALRNNLLYNKKCTQL